MKKLLVLFVLGAVSAAFGQTPAPVQAPDTSSDDVVRISTSLIRFDVSVTDPDGKVVRDLKPEDFEVFQNGERQSISTFSFVSSNVVKSVQVPSKRDVPAIPVPPVELRPENVRRAVALVVDDLSLSFQSTYQVQRALKKFVNEQMQDGDLVAIIRVGAGVGALQQFTSDRALLYAAIDKVRWNMAAVPRTATFEPVNDALDIREQSAASQALRDNAENAFTDFQTATFANGTFGALNYVVRGMSELPGRKSVVLFSEGYSLTVRDRSGGVAPSPVIDALSRLIENANRNSVVMYTVDTRGVEVAGYDAADSVSTNGGNAVLGPRRSEIIDTQNGLRYLAEQTGGFAIINNNDMAGGVRRVLDDQSYYLIGYEPESGTFDPKKIRFNSIVIKVRNRPDLRVRYRSGFFNFADVKQPAAPVAASPEAQLSRALVSPFGANGVSLRLNAQFANAKQGSFVNAVVHIDASDLTFVERADGLLAAKFQIMAVTFDENGSPVDQKMQLFEASIRKEDLESRRRNGYVYNLVLPVKRPGGYQFRIALRDSADGKVGSATQFVQVPDLKKKRLTLSGIVLQGLTAGQFEELDAGRPMQAAADGSMPDSFTATSLRRFARGTVLRYGFDVYNAGGEPGNPARLMSQVRVFRDGQLVFEGKPQEVNLAGQSDPARLNVSGAFSLAKQLEPGDYTMQVIVTEPSVGKEKPRVASQYVQFQLIAEGR